jgi:O-antigen/teichoic acid export membrane protein
VKAQVVSGAVWSGASKTAQQVLLLASTGLVAHLVRPSAYGLLGMASIVMGFIDIFKDLGTATAVVSRKEVDPQVLSSLFWFNVFFGACTAAVAIACAPLIAQFFRQPKLSAVIVVLSASLLLSGASTVQQSILVRDLAFKRLSTIEFTSVFISVAVACVLALRGAGVWSLVFSQVAAVLCMACLLWATSPWHPDLRFRWHDVRSVSSFGLNVTGFTVANYLVRNADNLLIGRFLGSTALGYYAIAYRLLLFPLSNVSAVLGRVLLPALAGFRQDNARVRKAYLASCAVIAAGTFPMMVLLFATAGPLVEALLGPRWASVVPLLWLFAPLGLVQSIGTTVGDIYLVKGRSDWLFRWGLFSGVCAIASFFIGLRWGIVGVASAYTAFSLLLAYPSFSIPFRLIDLKISELLQTLMAPFLYACLMGIAVAALRFVLLAVEFAGAWGTLISCTIVGIVTYSALILWRRPGFVRDNMPLLPTKRIPLLGLINSRLGAIEE